MVTIRSPFCGYIAIQCVELNGEDSSCYSNKIESVSLRKCLANNAYLSAITVTNISKSFTYKMAAKTNWHRYGTKLRHCHPMYIVYCSCVLAHVFVCHLGLRVLCEIIYSVFGPQRCLK